MANDFIDLFDESDEAVDIQCDPFEISDFPQTLVTEKIIFVIDVILLARWQDSSTDKLPNIVTFLSLLKSYMHLKKTTGVKNPEFECVLYNWNSVLHFTINSEKDLKEAFLSIQRMESDDDNEPLQINEVFDEIATLVELPDPDSLKKCLPPKWVYHVIWLFGRNLHVPTMQNTNSFDYLMMTPYFALDMLYLYDNTLSDSQCEQILQALLGLNENQKGYFLSGSVYSKKNLFASIAQFLGHPLIRIPQKKARYNIFELHNNLGGEVNVKNNNDEEE